MKTNRLIALAIAAFAVAALGWIQSRNRRSPVPPVRTVILAPIQSVPPAAPFVAEHEADALPETVRRGENRRTRLAAARPSLVVEQSRSASPIKRPAGTTATQGPPESGRHVSEIPEREHRRSPELRERPGAGDGSGVEPREEAEVANTRRDDTLPLGVKRGKSRSRNNSIAIIAGSAAGGAAIGAIAGGGKGAAIGAIAGGAGGYVYDRMTRRGSVVDVYPGTTIDDDYQPTRFATPGFAGGW
jgi:hypothetical protein